MSGALSPPGVEINDHVVQALSALESGYHPRRAGEVVDAVCAGWFATICNLFHALAVWVRDYGLTPQIGQSILLTLPSPPSVVERTPMQGMS